MALIEYSKVKTVSGNTQFSLTMPSNRSCRIRDIHIYNPKEQYATFTVNKTTVAYFRVGGGTLGNHLPFPIADEENSTLYRWLIDTVGFAPIPVASGQTLTIAGVHQASSLVTVVYDEYDGGDVRANEINGSDANRFQFINYGRYSTTLASGDNRYQTQQTPVQFPAFPYGEVVPAKHTMTLYGIVASDVNRYSKTNNRQRTTYLKLVKNRKTLFDDDLNGLPFFGSGTFVSNAYALGTGQGIIGNYDDIDRRLPFLFPKPLVFTEGESVDLYVTTAMVTGTANIPAASAEVGLIFDVQVNA